MTRAMEAIIERQQRRERRRRRAVLDTMTFSELQAWARRNDVELTVFAKKDTDDDAPIEADLSDLPEKIVGVRELPTVHVEAHDTPTGRVYGTWVQSTQRPGHAFFRFEKRGAR